MHKARSATADCSSNIQALQPGHICSKNPLQIRYMLHCCKPCLNCGCLKRLSCWRMFPGCGSHMDALHPPALEQDSASLHLDVLHTGLPKPNPGMMSMDCQSRSASQASVAPGYLGAFATGSPPQTGASGLRTPPVNWGAPSISCSPATASCTRLSSRTERVQKFLELAQMVKGCGQFKSAHHGMIWQKFSCSASAANVTEINIQTTVTSQDP